MYLLSFVIFFTDVVLSVLFGASTFGLCNFNLKWREMIEILHLCKSWHGWASLQTALCSYALTTWQANTIITSAVNNVKATSSPFNWVIFFLFMGLSCQFQWGWINKIPSLSRLRLHCQYSFSLAFMVESIYKTILICQYGYIQNACIFELNYHHFSLLSSIKREKNEYILLSGL